MAKEDIVNKDEDEIDPLVRELCKYLIAFERRRLSSSKLNSAVSYNNTKYNPSTSKTIMMKADKPFNLSAKELTSPIERNVQKIHNDSKIYNTYYTNSTTVKNNSKYDIISYNKAINSESTCYDETSNPILNVSQNYNKNFLTCQNTDKEFNDSQKPCRSYSSFTSNQTTVGNCYQSNSNKRYDCHQLLNGCKNTDGYSSETNGHSESNAYSISCCNSCKTNEISHQYEDCKPVVNHDECNESKNDSPNFDSPCFECLNDHKCSSNDKNIESESCFDCQPNNYCKCDSQNLYCQDESCTNYERQVPFWNSHRKCAESCSKIYNYGKQCTYQNDRCRIQSKQRSN